MSTNRGQIAEPRDMQGMCNDFKGLMLVGAYVITIPIENTFVITKGCQASQGKTFVITKGCGAVTFVITKGEAMGVGGILMYVQCV